MATIIKSKKRLRGNLDATRIGPGGPWHSSAPARVRETYRSTEEREGWDAWRKHLEKRPLESLSKLTSGKRSPLTWSLPEGTDLDATIDLVRLLDKASRGKRTIATALENEAACWLSHAESSPADAALALECLAWADALPSLAAHLPQRLWWMLLNHLVAIGKEEVPSGSDPLVVQLLLGELPLVLAYSFPELDECRALGEAGRRTISQSMAELLDGEGLLNARHWHLMRPLLASWTRSAAVGRGLPGGWCDAEAQQQYPGLVQHALRLSRADGRQVLSPSDSAPWNRHLLRAAVATANDRAARRIAKLMGFSGQDIRKTVGKNLPSPAFEGEWAGVAMLRSDWSRTAPSLAVACTAGDVAMELNVGRDCLWSGNWRVDVRLNDKPLSVVSDWEESCWISDAEVDYLELEIHLSADVTVQRHILLARKHQFLFLADAVLGIQHGAIEYRGTLPLAGRSTFAGERETREGLLLVGGTARARVLPLGLPEWRLSRTQGELQALDRGRGDRTPHEQGLELSQAAEGECLFAPLFIDLAAGRLKKELTWRPLTVGQKREVLPSDVAVGYRVQIGKSQRLIYRSLSLPDIRTVLGKNLMHEFLVGNFKSDGEVETLLEIE